ncbi:N-6 DNA methylase [Nocardioides anomalus]|uniref:site-specific DNA-methyltransferase (adenine-specific) n=2 Tax=Nocardioides anomalus TaxID=2712223 RepID=A0A6G6WLN9_9ACTN|nr:N-6 DNA methylase [Nocardioides anomalus]
MAGGLDGLDGAAYHLGGESPREAAARVWTYLQGAYRRFRDDLAQLPDGDPAVGLTRERWLGLLLDQLGYGRVPAAHAGGLTAGDKQYPVSHLAGQTPVHLLGWGVPLDTRSPGVAGAARAPHSMVQELLNRTDDYLWAVLSNGRLVRLLRDSTTLTGFAYVEFDLEAMFDGDLYAEFTLLYLLCHQSRVEVPEGEPPTSCWLERWRTTAVSQGVRALNLLRAGVETALETLGTGFLQHPANIQLREQVAGGDVRLVDVHGALLRTVYRLLFWSVAEERGALLAETVGSEERHRYDNYFSSRRLRELALTRHGSNHDDLWQGVEFVLTALGSREGEPRLGLPGLGGLFTVTEADVLDGCRLPNTAVLSAMRSLSVVQPKGQPRRRVDFAQLGAEELGSIYESLLELVPRYDRISHAFSLEVLAGNDRKTSGSYYTPTELVELVLDTALDPVLDDVEKRTNTPEERAAALLDLKVCDPAVGSAHFLVAAARRIAMRLATARTGELDPTPTHFSDALHDVVARCLYGVDVNPMAADLAKVSLWLTAMTPGRPLSFLDHHIKVGNALLGTTPALLKEGIPNTAFAVLTGDDKDTVAAWKKANNEDRKHRGQADLFGDAGIVLDTTATRRVVAEVANRLARTETVDDIAWAAQRYHALRDDPDTIRNQLVADAWCAAFLGPKGPDDVPTLDRVLQQTADGTASEEVLDAVRAVVQRHRLFHWHLEFPEVFRTTKDGLIEGAYGWVGGFDAVLGNPPWERVKLQEQEFFATRAPEIANAKNAAARKKLIAALAGSDRQDLFDEFQATKRKSEAESHFLRASGRYPLTGVGDVNTYQVFAEHFRSTLGPNGRMGIITPTGLATDATTAPFFADTLKASRLAAFYDFENEAKIFAGVHNQFRFAISVMTGGDRVVDVRMAFYTRYVTDVPSRRFELLSDEVLLLNPNTGTLPVFRSRRDADITLACYRRHPVLIRDGGANPWGLILGRMLHMADDAGLFRAASDFHPPDSFDGWSWESNGNRWLPLYEAKMVSHYDHRYTTYEGASAAQLNKGALPHLSAADHDDPDHESLSRYWVSEEALNQFLDAKGWLRHSWLLGWRDIAASVNERTFIPSLIPRVPASGLWFAIPRSASAAAQLLALWSSFVWDYLTRQKMTGTHVTIFLTKQLAAPPPEVFEEVPAWSTESLSEFVRARVFELTYTSRRLASFAAEGEPKRSEVRAPYRWLPKRRDHLAAELDAAMFHVYGLDRADAEHVLDSFFVVRKYEERDHGEFRTKRLVLAAYDAMATAAETGVPFTTPLDPPPGEGPRHPEVVR